MYPRTVTLAPPTPTILGGDEMKVSIGGRLFIECRVRIGIIEKVAPVSIRADLITVSDSTTSAKIWGAPCPAELTALIVDDDLLGCCAWLCWAIIGPSYVRGRGVEKLTLLVVGVRVSKCRRGSGGTIGRRLLCNGARRVLRRQLIHLL